MKAFRRSRHQLVAVFEPAEAVTLSTLATQLTSILTDRPARDADPAVLRLLPDAYPDDAEASAEFRRFTADGLAERKVANANRVVRDLAGAATATSATAVKLDARSAQAWLRSLTDIRLTVANRLGIDQDGVAQNGVDQDRDDQNRGDRSVPSAALDPVLLDLYDWLGFVQGSLVDGLDR